VRKSGTIRTLLVFEAGHPSEFPTPLSNPPKQDRWSNEIRFPRTGKLLCAEESSAIVPDVSQHLSMGWVTIWFDYCIPCRFKQAKRVFSQEGSRETLQWSESTNSWSDIEFNGRGGSGKGPGRLCHGEVHVEPST
jgi:hypothetical protein